MENIILVIRPIKLPRVSITGVEYTCKLFSNFLTRETHNENTPIQIYWKFYNQKIKIFR